VLNERHWQSGYQNCLGHDGVIGGRMYRSIDATAAVLISQFESESARQQIVQSQSFKDHVAALATLIESANPLTYEEAYTTGQLGLRQAVGEIRGSHDPLAHLLPAYECQHRLYHFPCIEHFPVAQSLCCEEARTSPVASIQLPVTPGHLAIVEIVDDQTRLAQSREVSPNFQIVHVDARGALMPTEEPVA
jgi:hypothetical protein